MLVFGHVGLTTGAVAAGEALARKISKNPPPESPRFRLDYRMVVIGSMLPDLVDKPLWLLGSVLPSGRAFAHTLLFSLGLLAAGAILMKFRGNWLFILGITSLLHLVLDSIWRNLAVFLYPFYGQIPSLDSRDWVPQLYNALLTRPTTYVPEIIGAVVLLLMARRLVLSKGMRRFITAGVIG